MTLYEQIKIDFRKAYTERNMVKKNFLGVLKGDIESMKGKGLETSDDNVMGVVKAMEKSLKIINTPEALQELEYLKPYLPTLMSENQIRTIVTDLKANGKDSIRDIMTEFNTKYKGRADNKLVAQIARE